MQKINSRSVSYASFCLSGPPFGPALVRSRAQILFPDLVEPWLCCKSADQPETSFLFELISARYESRSIASTANQPFGDWNRIFPDPAMTLAAVDRLVHHSTILALNVESYRRREAIDQQRGPGRPASRATLKTQPD
ncbi:hypothetical protein GC209_16875 [bacterium]|nr:hypothetical protein [bacterium]